jgi:hypothetical protein
MKLRAAKIFDVCGQERSGRAQVSILIGCMLLASSMPAGAFVFNLGDGYSGAFDSTISYGAQMRMQGQSCKLIGQDNGGCAALSAALPEATEDAYFINADDGDQNYKKYDVFSEVVKLTNELQLKAPDGLSAFARISELGDWRIGQTERTQLTDDAERFSVYNVQLLDAYISQDFDLFDRSMRIRVGNQVMSWGEDIFVLGGINSINSIDVRRYHVAGTQVKEILRPAPMISFSSDIVEGVSTEAYWQWHWNSFQLDPTGTYFSSADPAGKGNDRAIFIPTSSINNGLNALSSPTNTASNQAEGALVQAALASGAIRYAPAGTVGDPGGTGLTAAQLMTFAAVGPRLINGFTNPNFVGGAAASRAVATTLVDAAFSSGTAIPLVSDSGASNHGQYGLSFRYHPEWVDAGFGLYYEHYNSKIPFITYTVNSAYKTDNPVSAGYKIEYPNNRQLLGTSYNTQIGSWAYGGELSWRPNDAVAIDTSVPTDNGKNPYYACLNGNKGGNGGGEQNGYYCKGWVDRAKYQFQQSALQIFSPTDSLGGFLLPVLGAKEGYFLGEFGATYYPGLGRLDGTPWSLPAYALPNKFSAGYTLESQITYPNVLNLGYDWLPQIDWSQGIMGNTPNSLPWQSGVKSATATLNFNKHNIITAALAYSWFWGGGTQNQTSDRDFLSFTVGYNF